MGHVSLIHAGWAGRNAARQWLMKGTDLTSAFEMCAIKTDEITALGSGRQLRHSPYSSCISLVRTF